jgi:hypothetical protein
MSYRLQRAVLDRLSPALAAIPLTRTERPATRRWGPRTRFKLRRGLRRALAAASGGRWCAPRDKSYTRYGPWLREDLSDWVRAVLLDDRTLDRGILDPAFVRRTLDSTAPPDRVWTWRVGLMLSLELMLRQNVDG